MHGRAARGAAPISALLQQPGATGSRVLPDTSVAAAGKEGCKGGGVPSSPLPGH